MTQKRRTPVVVEDLVVSVTGVGGGEVEVVVAVTISESSTERVGLVDPRGGGGGVDLLYVQTPYL